MIVLIFAFGLLLFLSGIVIVIEPTSILVFLNHYKNERFVYVCAIAARLIVGVSLVVTASRAVFPSSISVIGWLFIVSAVFLGVIGHGQFIRLMRWVLHRFASHARLAGGLGIGLGGFLMYAFV